MYIDRYIDTKKERKKERKIGPHNEGGPGPWPLSDWFNKTKNNDRVYVYAFK